MAVTVNIYYKGKGDNARLFAQEMINSGIVSRIRSRNGNLKYEYFLPMEDSETVLLIDSWENQQALDSHHASEIMGEILFLREKYDLTMRVERFVCDENGIPDTDKRFIRTE